MAQHFGKNFIFFSIFSRNEKYFYYFYKDNDTFEFTRHVSVVQRPSSVESRINLKLHLNL